MKLGLVIFVASFLVLLAAINFGFYSIFGQIYSSKKAAITSSLRTNSLTYSLDPSIRFATESKLRHEFWATTEYEDGGIGIRALSDPKLFSFIFPGYPDKMRYDTELWNEYFSIGFDPSSYFEGVIDKLHKPVFVHYSWSGCIEIFRRYGADVIVFGSSEVHRGMVLDRLGNRLKTLYGNRTPKVLFCTVGSMTAKMVEYTAQKLKETHQPKADFVIWGYSFWNAFTRGESVRGGENAITKREFDLYAKRNELTKIEDPFNYVRFSQFFGPISWEMFIPFNFTELNQYITTGHMKRGAPDGLEVSAELAQSASELNKKLEERQWESFSLLSGSTKADCKFETASNELNSTLKALRDISKQTFLYLTPVTTMQIHSAPDCLREGVKKMFISARSASTSVRTDEMPEYGLDNRDFLQPTRSTMHRIDFTHSNYYGALKVTNSIADWIVSIRRDEAVKN